MRPLRVLCALAAVLPVFAQTQLTITTTSPLPAATQNSSYSFTFQASGGTPPYTWSLQTAPPPGLNFSAGGSLSGTPTQTGGYILSVSVQDYGQQNAAGRFSLTVQAPPLAITSTSPLPNGTVGVNYSYAMSAMGGTPPYSWSVIIGSLPAGLSLSSSGQISGTPTTAGTSSFAVQVTNGGANIQGGVAVGVVGQFSLTIQSVVPALTITGSPPGGTVGTSYAYSLTAAGGTPPYSWSLVSGSLPAGLALSPGGQIGGTPATAGSSAFTVGVNDNAKGHAQTQFNITIAAKTTSGSLTITSASPLPNGAANVAYSYTMTATGGTAPYNWSLVGGSLPSDFPVSSAGRIGRVRLRAAGETGGSAPFTLATTSVTGGGGLTLSPSGVLSGTPTVAGLYTFSIGVTDSPLPGVAQQSGSATFMLRILPPLTVTTPSPINAILGTPLTIVMDATGGVFPYIWQFAPGSQPPPGFTLDTTSGFLMGTPTTLGTFNFTVQATDRAGSMATKALSMIVTAGISITPAGTPNGAAGASYSLTFAAAGAVAPLTWTVDSGTLPAGLTLNGATGVLTGTPQVAGTFMFVIRVTDSNKATSTKSITLTINPAGQGVLVAVQSLAFTAIAGGSAPATQSFDLATSASTALQFTIATDGGSTGSAAPAWLTVLLLQGSTPARIPVAVDQTGLPAGNYAARILVNTSDGQQTIVTVTLTLTTAPPQLDVSPGYLRYGGSVSALAASEEDLLVRNIGGGGALAFQVSLVGSPTWLSVTPASGQAGPNAPVLLRVLVNAQGLPTGARNAMIAVTSAAGSVNIPVSLYVRADGPAIATDVSGVQFEGRQGNGDANGETVNVLNLGTGTVNWQAQIVTGGAWLSIGGPASGQSTPAASSALTLLVNPSVLTAGPYYALVILTDPNSLNSPQYLAVMLNVDAPAAAIVPQPDPEGLFFVAKAGGAPTAAQSVSVFASSSTPVAFQASASTASGGNWLSVSPASGTTSVQATAQVSVNVNPLNLKAGIYTGEVSFALSNTSVRSTNVTLVVQPTTVTPASLKRRAPVPGCTPAKLAVAPTGLANSFAAPAGWPTALSARLADDCGSPVLNGQLVVTFSNGDPALTMKLTDSKLGVYSATWAPSHVNGSMTMTAHGSAPGLLAATVDITGAVTANQAPVLATNGTLNDVNPVVGAPLAPGTVAQVNGSSLAAANAQPDAIPAPAAFNGTQVLVGAFTAPLYALSSGQLTVQLPNELAPGQEYPVLVAANGGYTLPDTITTAAASPGVFVYPDNSAIAQHMDSSLVNADSPASQNETIGIFLVGMGATDTPVASGAAAPSNPPANVLATPVVTVGGAQATVVFAGLVPGGVGIYQIMLTVPTGLGTGYLPLSISQNGVAANAATLPVE